MQHVTPALSRLTLRKRQGRVLCRRRHHSDSITVSIAVRRGGSIDAACPKILDPDRDHRGEMLAVTTAIADPVMAVVRDVI